jgi:Domain of unknown function (DUF4440)
MRILLVVVVGVLFSIPSVRAQTNDEEELARIEGQISRLEQRNDTTLAKYLADDWVCFGARNLTKEQFIQNLQQNKSIRIFRFSYTPEMSSSRIEKKNVQVRVFGDTAVVTYIKEYHQTSDPSKFFGEDDTDFFTRDGSNWHLRFTRVSPTQTRSASN